MTEPLSLKAVCDYILSSLREEQLLNLDNKPVTPNTQLASWVTSHFTEPEKETQSVPKKGSDSCCHICF